MAEYFPIDIPIIGVYSGSFSGSFQGDGSGLTGISGSGGSTNTGSLLTTASFTSPNMTFTKGNGSTFNVDISKIVDGGTF
tara:strand:+ start:527 stop:766 length:240 start_codon:yes stop_codon:yes gene_type:complete